MATEPDPASTPPLLALSGPFADLHRHLDGSIRPSTLAELAERAGVKVPDDLAFSAGMGLSAALSRFAFTLSLIQKPKEVRRVAAEMCEDAAAEKVSTLEIRFAPQLHKAAPIEAIIEAALDGIAGRAGLLLCGLYGEPPELLRRLVEAGAKRPGVVGIDLAGGPGETNTFELSDYSPAYRRAEELGLGRTVHAGEGRPAREIRLAVEVLNAQRIGHGITLLDDPDLVDLVIERNIVIEACPTSNVHTGSIASLSSHPLPIWLSAGVRACVCTDNTLLSAVDATEEHRRALSIPGMDERKLRAAVAFGHKGAFAFR